MQSLSVPEIYSFVDRLATVVRGILAEAEFLELWQTPEGKLFFKPAKK